ncbi:hypothetical protein ONZ45_g6731 [Pleurotus djamor]|nr:hypothetical protein ONZ45_g6731 [Pleurotus djamor]
MSSLSDIPPLLSPPPPLPASHTSSNPDILLRIETPYKADAFDRFFANYPHLKSRYPHLTDKLRRGFPMGDFPESLDQTQTWENGRSVQEHSEFVDEYFAEEVQAGRLSGPYSQSVVEGILGGHFQCSPITVNVQPQGLGEEPKLRLCSDFSRGSNSYPATNDYSDIRDFPTRFDGVLQVADEVSFIVDRTLNHL